MYKVDIPDRVKKQLDKLSDKIYDKISEIIFALSNNPRPSGCKKITDSLYRIRFGNYRVLYWIGDKELTVIITKVEKRSEKTYKGIKYH